MMRRNRNTPAGEGEEKNQSVPHPDPLPEGEGTAPTPGVEYTPLEPLPPVIEAPVEPPPPPPPLRPETVRVKAKRHLAEEDLNGNLTHRVPGEVFEITFERAMALGENLLEEADEDEPLGPPSKGVSTRPLKK